MRGALDLGQEGGVRECGREKIILRLSFEAFTSINFFQSIRIKVFATRHDFNGPRMNTFCSLFVNDFINIIIS